MDRSTVEKAAFVVSLAVLAYLFGFATNTFGWFPADFLQKAWLQGQLLGERAAEPPAFLSARVHDRAGVRVPRPDEVQPGLTLVATIWDHDGWKPGLRLVDARGRVLHQWPVDPLELFSASAWHTLSWNDPDIQGAHLLPDGDVVLNVEYVGSARLDACGNVEWRLSNGGHHSVERADDGSFWIPGVTGRVPARSPSYPDGYPGLDGHVFKDLLMRVAPDGEVLQEIAVLDLLYDNGLERHIAKQRRVGSQDITHLNDIQPLADSLADEYPSFDAGDLALSMKGLDLVLVVDPDTRRVKWSASRPFIEQHDPDFIGDGWIGVFDNNVDRTDRGTMLGGSRVVALSPESDSIRVLFPTPESDPLYTSYRGKWQRLANGNLLLTEAKAGRVVEVAPDGGTVWEWITEPYDSSRVPEVSEGTRYDLTPEQVERWPCSPSKATPEETGQEAGG